MTAATLPRRSPVRALERMGVRPTRRAVGVGIGLAVCAAGLALVGLATGDYLLNPVQVVEALLGHGGFATTIVQQWRLPRVAAALVLGAALGASGAVFQSMTRNPLGSPDVIGFSTGAYTGALLVMLVLGGAVPTAVGALVGGLLTAAVVFALSHRGGLSGFRLIVVGIGVTATLGSVNQWLLLRADTETARAASIWGIGSLSLVGWDALWPTVIAVALLGLLLVALAPALRQLELGDDVARSHGVAVGRDRALLLVVGVALIAVVIAAAGPIAFVALAAPQVAKRLLGGAGVPLAGAAQSGAVLLLGADLAAQHLVPTALPVGAVTVVLGGGYLVALLLVGAVRRGR